MIRRGARYPQPADWYTHLIMRLPWKRRANAAPAPEAPVPTTVQPVVAGPLPADTGELAGTRPEPRSPGKQLTPAQAMAAAAASPSALAAIGGSCPTPESAAAEEAETAAAVGEASASASPVEAAWSPGQTSVTQSAPLAASGPPASPRRRGLVPRWLPWAAGAAALVVVLAALAIYLVARADLVRVPSLTGLNRSAAEARLQELGLRLTVGDRRFSASATVDTIVDQRPTAGTQVEAGSAVQIALSAGSETFAMPDVVGRMLDAARASLQQRGLFVTVQTIASDQTQGTVLATVPSAGIDVQTGAAVQLTVAAGAGATGTLLPSDLTGKVFVLDPAPVPGGTTADATMDVARRVRALLEASGARVIVTRSATDLGTPPDTAARAKIAKETTSDALVGFSLAASGPDGLGVTGMPNTSATQKVYLASFNLSQALFTSLKSDFSTVTSTTAAAGSDTILTDTGAPGVRLRLGAASSSADKLAFADSTWADKVAKDVYRALAQVFGVK
jgi:N-acetylmuramoyl-L-alanine amidase